MFFLVLKICFRQCKKLVPVTSFLFCGCIVSLPAMAIAPEDLLAKMTEASRTLSYAGTFTYEDGGGTVDAMGVTHIARDGVEQEFVQHLNGPIRRFSLPARDSKCEPVGNRLLTSIASVHGSGNPHYFYAVRGRSRVAGREVDILRVVPKDEYRYGLTLGLDVDTGLLLLAAVMTPQKVLERVQFTSFKLLASEPELQSLQEHIVLNRAGAGTQASAGLSPAEMLNTSVPTQEPKSVASGAGAINSAGTHVATVGSAAAGSTEERAIECASSKLSMAPLTPSWLPAGFELSVSAFSEDVGYIETYTDGLSSFTVTVQSRSATRNDAMQGEAQRGATVITLALIAVNSVPVQVTIIGEIPPVTASRVLRSLRPSDER